MSKFKIFSNFTRVKKVYYCIYLKFNSKITEQIRKISINAFRYNEFKQINLNTFIWNVPLLYCIPSLLPFKKVGEKYPETKQQAETYILQIIDMADSAVKTGELGKAELILAVGLEVADKFELHSALSKIYEALASLALIKGDVVSTEHIIITAIEKLTKAGLSEDDNVILNFKLKLARLYSAFGEEGLAEIGFKECVQAQEKKLKDGFFNEATGSLYVNSLFWYGMFLLENNRLDESYRCIERSYYFSSKVRGLKSSQEMTILTILSQISFMQGEYDKALRNMINAVIIGKNIGHPELASSYVMLGLIYLKKQVYDKAKEWCELGGELGQFTNNAIALEESNACIEEINTVLASAQNKKPKKDVKSDVDAKKHNTT